MRLRLHFPSLVQVPANWSPLQRERLQQVAAQAFVQAAATFNVPDIQIEFVAVQPVKGVTPVIHAVPRDRTEHIFAAPSLDTPISGHIPAANQNTPQVGGAQIHPIRTDVHIGNNNPSRSTDAHQEGTQQRHHPMLDEHYPDQAIGPLSERRQVFVNNSHPNVVYDDSFDHQQQYPIALEEGDPAQANGPIIYSLEEDSVSEESFPEIAILQGKSGAYVHAGGRPFVKAQNLARALHWGAHLFAHDGFVVLQGEAASSAGTFFIVPLKEPVQFAEESTFSLPSGEQVIGISASLLHTTDYTIIIVVDDRGRSFFGNREQDPWTYQQVTQTLAQLNQSTFNTPTLSEVTHAQPEQTRLASTDHGILSIIGWMDRTLFAALPWKKRYAYLILLIAAWRSEQEKTILLHIICSTRTGAELAAIFALLRKQGKYAKLFEHFDIQLYEMLQVLGDFTPDYGLDWHYLAAIVTHAVHSFQALHAMQEMLQELLNMASGLLEWLVSRRVNFLFSASEEIAVLPEQLSLLLWLIQKARSGDRPVQMFLTEVVAQTDSPIKKAIRGFSSVHPVLTDEPHYQGDGRTQGDAPTLEKLHAAFILKFLRQFLGTREVHAALDATEDPVERLEILTKSLTSEHVTNNILSNLTEQMSRGLDMLLEYPQWDRAAIIDLLIGLPASSRHSFLYTMLFVAPSQLEMWELQTLQELAVHPRAQALIREAGYELFVGVFQHVRHSWIRLDLFVERLAVKRRAIGDPLAYQEFLDRLGNGDADAFAEVDHAGFNGLE